VPQARDQRRNIATTGRPNYGGLEVSEAKRLKGLESENAKLKKLLADAMLDNAALKDLLTKKW
jgi:putative transposase